MYYAFVYVPLEGNPQVFIMDSMTSMEYWRKYKQEEPLLICYILILVVRILIELLIRVHTPRRRK
jgi:hypothetical protein